MFLCSSKQKYGFNFSGIIGVRFTAGAKIFPFSAKSGVALGHTQPLTQYIPGGIYTRISPLTNKNV